MATMIQSLTQRQFAVRDTRDIERQVDQNFIRSCRVSTNITEDDFISTIALCISSDGRYVASSHGNHTIRVYCYDTWELVSICVGHWRTVWNMKFHPTDPNILVSGSLDKTVRIWNWKEGSHQLLSHEAAPVLGIAFRPDGNLLVYNSQTMIGFMDMKTRQTLPLGIESVKNMRAAKFLPNGVHLLVAAPAVDSNPAFYGICELRYLAVTALEEGSVVVVEYVSLPMLLEGIHCYSEGGVDISKDGTKMLVHDARPGCFGLSLYRLETSGTDLHAHLLGTRRKTHYEKIYGVVSVRFLPSEDHALLSYGIKPEYVGVHQEFSVVWEIVRLSDFVTVRHSDSSDEINATEFHPRPGMGFVYGTKKGHIVNVRANM